MMTKRTQNRALLLASIALLLTLTIWIKTRNDQGQEEPISEGPIAIGYPMLRIAMPVFVAKEKGFFEDQGLDVNLIRYPTAQPMMDALVGGSIDIGGYCALPITFSAIARSHTQLLFLSAMMEDAEHPISMLIAGNPTDIPDIRSLEGKRIGILPTRAYEVWLQKVLERHDVDAQSVVIQQVPPPQQAVALQSGSVQALFTNDPAATAALMLGAGTNLTPGRAIVPEATGFDPFYFGSFNIRKEFADRHPETVRKISLALDEAVKFIAKNPDAARQSMALYLPSEQQALTREFPPSLFQECNEVEQEDLQAILDYYLEEEILTIPIDLEGAQYRRN